MTARDAARSQVARPRETSLLLTDSPLADGPFTRSLAVCPLGCGGVPPPVTPDLNDLRLVTPGSPDGPILADRGGVPAWPLGLSMPSVLIRGELFLRVSAPPRCVLCLLTFFSDLRSPVFICGRFSAVFLPVPPFLRVSKVLGFAFACFLSDPRSSA